VTKSDDLSEDSKADIISCQEEPENFHLKREIEENTLDNRAAEGKAAFNDVGIERYEAIKRQKKRKQNDTPAQQLVDILKESSSLSTSQNAEKKTQPPVSKSTSFLDTLDNTDLFFLNMSRMTKQLPKVEQSQIKLALSNSVLSAEVRSNQQPCSSTSYSDSIPPHSFDSSPSPAPSQDYSSGEYSTTSANNNKLTVLEMLSLPQSHYQ